MADYNGYVIGNTTGIATGTGPLRFLQIEFNVADFIEDEFAGVAQNWASPKTIKLMDVDADVYLELMQAEVVTAFSLGAGAELELGDETDDDEMIAAASTLTAGTNLTITKSSLTNGLILSAAEDLNLKLTGATVASGLVRFVFKVGEAARIAPAVVPDAGF